MTRAPNKTIIEPVLTKRESRGIILARRNRGNTRLEIIHTALTLFLRDGYSNTYIPAIAKEIGISKGNLMFHFRTKEHLLAELINMLCDFQWKLMERETTNGTAHLPAYLLEIATIASVCVENPVAKDLYVSAYIYPMALEIIRKNDTQKAKQVFGAYCKEWTETDFMRAENVVSGIEYAMLIDKNTEGISLEQRIESALDAIMKQYELPKELRKDEIARVLAMDYRGIGNHMLKEFTEYVHEKSKNELLNAANRNAAKQSRNKKKPTDEGGK